MVTTIHKKSTTKQDENEHGSQWGCHYIHMYVSSFRKMVTIINKEYYKMRANKANTGVITVFLRM